MPLAYDKRGNSNYIWDSLCSRHFFSIFQTGRSIELANEQTSAPGVSKKEGKWGGYKFTPRDVLSAPVISNEGQGLFEQLGAVSATCCMYLRSIVNLQMWRWVSSDQNKTLRMSYGCYGNWSGEHDCASLSPLCGRMLYHKFDRQMVWIPGVYGCEW